jgi:5-(carboxyamino)imidazole ribonucleotide mutase
LLFVAYNPILITNATVCIGSALQHPRLHRAFCLARGFRYRRQRKGKKLSEAPPLVGIIMGSRSDWETMREASAILAALGVAHECKVVSAHRTPDRLYDYAKSAVGRGLQCIIAGAGGAAHLPGMVAAMTRLPVLGVPVQSKALDGMDSLLSIVQMPAGIPVGTLAIGKAGATNAALLAAAMLANNDPALADRLDGWRAKQTDSVGETPE